MNATLASMSSESALLSVCDSGIVTWPCRDRTLAVLPFLNLSSSDDHDDPLGIGLTEELTGAMARIDGLSVPSRRTALYFERRDHDIQALGQHLRVARLLEGSIRRQGNRVRVVSRLMNVADGFQLWSERYDVEFGDVFELQDNITQRILSRVSRELAMAPCNGDPVFV